MAEEEKKNVKPEVPLDVQQSIMPPKKGKKATTAKKGD